MFKKAGIEGWKAFVPFYNTWCMVEKMPLKKYWFFLQLIPIAGQFITIWICIKFVEHFGRFGFLHHAAVTVVPFIYFPYMGFSKNERYAGTAVVKNYKKSGGREWIDAAAFAVVAATLIRTFIFEAYTIPTPSMEKTLLVNDFLFVSKFAYGPRLPNTPIAMPFMHHTIPVANTKSYVEWIKIPYTRWFESPVKRNDAVVFNFPVNDTLINDEQYGSQTTYYEAIRQSMQEAKVGYTKAREMIWDQYGDRIIVRPVDKRENFIKRCVGIAGDSLKIVNGILYVNGTKAEEFPQQERMHWMTKLTNGGSDMDMLAEMGITVREMQNDIIFPQGDNKRFLVNITNEEKKALPINSKNYKIDDYIAAPDPKVFPYFDTASRWSADNYGPIWVPARGATIQLTQDNMIRYRRCIEQYEGNTIEQQGTQYLINGKPATTYTFKMNYYWMMGDNRHNSLDSRFWGFVPEDHVVGRASLIWFSWEGGPRWKRMFQSIK